MRRDEIDPEITAELEAIDATLAGEPVDPAHAELAELAVLLRADRPPPASKFTENLDKRVQERFSRRPAPAAPSARSRRRSFISRPAFGVAGVGLLTTVAAVIALSSGGRPTHTATATSPTAAAQGRASAGGTPAAPAPTATTATESARPVAPAPATPGAVAPPNNGRKIVQSASVELGAPADRIDAVAQEVFNVVGSAGGIVDSSTVTATGGPDGNAQFQLRVPSSSLARTMAALSRLRYANVLSRTDNTQDVNQPYTSAQKRLADATALRGSLLKQLQSAGSQQQIDSLKAQIRDAEASIAAAKADLDRLNSQINYSRVTVTIAASNKGSASGSGFSLGGAAHSALRVLTVAAGVALIGIAAAVPAALLGALAWWAATAVKRRRREQVLDHT